MLSNRPVASVKNLSKAYGSFVVFNAVNFSIQQGEKIGLVGANGSGKSTLLQILNGQVKPDEGQVLISKGVSVGYVPQEFEAAQLSGGEKTRAALAKIFSADQDFLLLDEPTNNLDIEALESLEYALQNFVGRRAQELKRKYDF